MAEPDPKNPSHRTKAHQLRKARDNGQTLAAPDAIWLADYEEKQQRQGKPQSYGHSKSGRRVVEHREIEEATEAEGTGPTAAAVAVGHALQSREEGRRLDSLTEKAVAALKEACAVYKDICLSLRDQLALYQGSQIAMFEAWRNNYLARVETEGELQQQQRAEDPAKDMLLLLIAKKLGLDLPAGMLPPGPRPAPRPRPPTNGAPTPTRP